MPNGRVLVVIVFSSLGTLAQAHECECPEPERWIKLGIRAGRLAGDASRGWSLGLVGTMHAAPVEVSFTRDVAASGASRNLVDTTILVPLRSHERGPFRSTLVVGMSSGFGVGGRYSRFLDYNLAVVAGASLVVGRVSLEARYRHGLLDMRLYGPLYVPGFDFHSRTTQLLVGIRY